MNDESYLDRILPVLTSIEALTQEDRERLFIALYEQYQWLPEQLKNLRDMIPIPYDPGVSASGFDAAQGGEAHS